MSDPCITIEQIELFRAKKLSPAELLRLDDHLANCDACRSMLIDTSAPSTPVLAPLADAPADMWHPTAAMLGNYVEGRLPMVERTDVQYHAETCTVCRARIDNLQSLHATGAMKSENSWRLGVGLRSLAPIGATACLVLLAILGVHQFSRRSQVPSLAMEPAPPAMIAPTPSREVAYERRSVAPVPHQKAPNATVAVLPLMPPKQSARRPIPYVAPPVRNVAVISPPISGKQSARAAAKIATKVPKGESPDKNVQVASSEVKAPPPPFIRPSPPGESNPPDATVTPNPTANDYHVPPRPVTPSPATPDSSAPPAPGNTGDSHVDRSHEVIRVDGLTAYPAFPLPRQNGRMGIMGAVAPIDNIFRVLSIQDKVVTVSWRQNAYVKVGDLLPVMRDGDQQILLVLRVEHVGGTLSCVPASAEDVEALRKFVAQMRGTDR